MKTIDDITYNTNYGDATFRFLLLNQQYSTHIGPTPIILLPNALLMTFIHVFHDLGQCQDHIINDNRKLIRLAISDQKIIEWNANNNNVSDNSIDKIYIFCGNYSNYLAMKKWNGCYKDKVYDVCLSDTLDYNLIKLGIDYIYKILPEFRRNRPLFRQFGEDGKKLSRALEDYFQGQIDSLGDEAGEEAQD